MEIAITAEGAHPGTILTLEALQWLHEDRDFAKVLDMGCGNGILGVTAATVWGANVLAADISPQALEDAKQNVAQNALEDRITLIRSDGFTNPDIAKNAPYDLIIFNLLAEPIVELAPQVRSHLLPGGIAIISGILSWKAADTKLAYSNLGFEILKEFSESPWHAIIVQRSIET